MPEQRNFVRWTPREANLIEMFKYAFFNPYKEVEDYSYQRLLGFRAFLERSALNVPNMSSTLQTKLDYDQPVRSSTAYRTYSFAVAGLGNDSKDKMLLQPSNQDFMTVALTMTGNVGQEACMNDLFKFFEKALLPGYVQNDPQARNLPARELFNRQLTANIDALPFLVRSSAGI